jgi:cobalt-zinc-cadmium efflux system outer membrane protein
MRIRWITTSIAALGLAGLALVASSAWSSSPTVDRPMSDENRPLIRVVPPPILDFQPSETIETIGSKDPILPPAERLTIPPELPGSDAPPLQVPKVDPANPQAADEAIKKLYPPLPPLGDNFAPGPALNGRSLSLADLQKIALANNPGLRQAEASIRAARGDIVQAGLYPNPTAGFAADSVNQDHTSGQVGGFISQEIVLLAKLRLAKAVAAADRDLAEQAYLLMEAEVYGGVRAGYFAVLAAQETMRVQLALTKFTDEVYRVQVDLVRAGQAAPYEPLQLRVLAYQARGQLVQARNRHVAAWKQLASAFGQPNMPPTLLGGSLDQPLPLLRHDVILDTVLANHSEVRSAQIGVDKAANALRLAQTNRIPNMTVATTVQRDFTTGLGNATYNFLVGVPVPIFNRNQGNIMRARAELDRAAAESAKVSNDLTARVAEAFERYDNQRRQLVYYRDHILPDQVRAYRGVYGRHRQDADKVGFGEVITAQQTLVGVTAAYLQTLRDAWTAVVDLGKLAQTPDLMALGTERCDTRPPGLCGACGKPLIEALPWPEVMPGGVPVSRTGMSRVDAQPVVHPVMQPIVPLAIPDPPTVAPAPMYQLPTVEPVTPFVPRESELPPPLPRVVPHPVIDPVTDAVMLPPTVGPMEKCTKRRRFFGFPMRKPDGEPAPMVLPRFEDLNGCCPPFSPSMSVSPASTPAPELLPDSSAPPKIAPKGSKTSAPEPEIVIPEARKETAPAPRILTPQTVNPAEPHKASSPEPQVVTLPEPYKETRSEPQVVTPPPPKQVARLVEKAGTRPAQKAPLPEILEGQSPAKRPETPWLVHYRWGSDPGLRRAFARGELETRREAAPGGEVPCEAEPAPMRFPPVRLARPRVAEE